METSPDSSSRIQNYISSTVVGRRFSILILPIFVMSYRMD